MGWFSHRALALTGCLTAAGLIGGASRADAQEIDFQYSTQGCFTTSSAGCNPTSTVATISNILTFTGSTNLWTFSTGDEPNVAGFNLGRLELASGTTAFSGWYFTLLTTFSDPNITSGSSTDTRSAMLTGAVKYQSGVDRGFAKIVFDPNEYNRFFFEQAPHNGYFEYRPEGETIVYAGGTATLNGEALVTVTPEPVSSVLLGTGLAGLVGLRRRRKNRLEAETAI